MITKEELVRIKKGDGLVVESNGIRHYNASEVLINGHSLTEVLEAAAAYKEEQPKVLDADGIEIKPGDELYYKDKKPFIDGKFAGIAKELHTDECPNPWEGNRPWVRYEEGGWDLAERLTHQKPENLQDVIDDLRKEMLSQEFGHIIRVPAEIINRLEAIAKRMGGDGVERTLDNVVERMPEVGDKQVSKSTVANWVNPGKNPWCPIESRREKRNKPGILFDPDLEAALEDW